MKTPSAKKIEKELEIDEEKINITTLYEGKDSFVIPTQLDELNDYLRMLANMDKVGIRRKIVLLEGYINIVKNKKIKKK